MLTWLMCKQRTQTLHWKPGNLKFLEVSELKNQKKGETRNCSECESDI